VLVELGVELRAADAEQARRGRAVAVRALEGPDDQLLLEAGDGRMEGQVAAIGQEVGGWRAARLELDRGHSPVPAGRWLYRAACWFRASARVAGGPRDR